VDYLSQALNMSDIDQQMRDYSAYVAGVFSERVLPDLEGETDAQSWLTGSRLDDMPDLKEDMQKQMQTVLGRIDAQLSRGMLPERSRKHVEFILDKAMPCWLDDSNGLQALRAFSDLLHTIAGRATWVDLLATHQGVLDWLVGVLSASRYLSEHIVKNPAWLEWPLENDRGATEIHRLCEQINALDADKDEEEFLATLGRLIDQARIQCALAVDAHKADSIAIGHWLSDVADASTQACFRSSLQQLKLPCDFPMVALALGKHGSREMGLVSDLDMVFVLLGNPNTDMNKRSAREWAQRLGRRVIRQLTGMPPFGAGYEFDARLRPSGNSGVLVTTLDGFRDYQLTEAQTWEHQALCRVRAVTGTDEVKTQVMTVIQEVLELSREHQSLAADVMQMREKMLEHLSSKTASIINLKHDAGGLVDIEFLAQYACLLFNSQRAGAYSTVQSLLNLPDSAPKVWHDAANMLAKTYIIYRDMENALRVELWQSIGQLSMDGDAPEWETMRRHTAMKSPQALQETMRQVHSYFSQLLT